MTLHFSTWQKQHARRQFQLQKHRFKSRQKAQLSDLVLVFFSTLQIYRFKRHCLASLNKKKFRLPKQCFKLLKIAQLSVLVFIFFSALPNCQNIVSNYFRKQRIAPLLSKYFQQCQLPNIVSYSVRRHRSATLISKCISSSNYKTSFRIASEGTV